LPQSADAHELTGKKPWQQLLQGESARQAEENESKLGQLLDAGNFEQALPVAESLATLRKAEQGADHWQAVDARWKVETIHRLLQAKDKDRQDWRDCLPLGREAEKLKNAGRYRQEQPLREKILAVHRRILGEDHPDTAQSYNDLASIHYTLANNTLAEAGLRKALTIFRKVLGEEHPQTASSYNNLAFISFRQGKYAQALPLLRRALTIFFNVLGEEHSTTAACQNNLGKALLHLGKAAEAEESFRRALAVFRKRLSEEHAQTAHAYNNIAACMNIQGKHAEAETIYRKSLSIRRRVLGDLHPDTAISYGNLGSNLSDQGKYAEAESAYREALAIFHNIFGEEHPETVVSYNGFGLCLNSQGKYAEARVVFEKALAIRRKTRGEGDFATAVSYNNLALNLSAQGKYAEAEASYRKALAIFLQTVGEKNPQTSACYNNLAHNLNAQGRYGEADADFRKALTLRREILGETDPRTLTSYNNLAFNLECQGKHAEAEESFRKALTLRRKLGEERLDTANSYRTLATNLSGQGRYAEAEANARRALAISRKLVGDDHPASASAFSILAKQLHAQGKYAEAEAYWAAATASFAKRRILSAATGLDRVSISSKDSPLRLLTTVLARNGKFDLAWERFEESLARGIWDDLCARLRRPADEQDRQTQLATRLSHIDQRIERSLGVKARRPEQERERQELFTQRLRVKNELDAFSRHLEQTYGPTAGQVFSRAQIQAALPADTALVGWIDIDGQAKAADPNGEHWAVLLRALGGPEWVRLRGSGPGGRWTEADSRLPDDLRAALRARRGDWKTLAQQLWQQRLESLAKFLSGSNGQPPVQHLVVLPAPALAGVPVEVLTKDVTVSYALSGTIHAHLQKQPQPTSKGLLALGDPIFTNKEWETLPGTRFELEALGRLFKDPKLLNESQASEQTLHELAQSGALGRYRYLHFATHGEVDARFPLRSALILSSNKLPDPAKQLAAGLPIYDGRLSADKVLRQWHLNSELVTLSACQTALGKYERGEGFVGFAQSLLLAGSRSVVLSLWRVDDTATALLMERFYQNLLGKRAGLESPLAKAAALAEAKQWLRSLSRAEVLERTAELNQRVMRGPGRRRQPLLPPAPTAKPPTQEAPPFAHPNYWAAFVLIGEP
jgi:CHAT domain-containing protein/Tfp pilus assembly protein PilF